MRLFSNITEDYGARGKAGQEGGRENCFTREQTINKAIVIKTVWHSAEIAKKTSGIGGKN